MLTNEQRAHDLALVVLKQGMTADVLAKAISKDDNDCPVDIGDLYLRAYEPALKFFDKHFTKA